MYPILKNLLSDNESLYEFERNEGIVNYTIPYETIKQRLISMERLYNPIKNDIYYENLGRLHLDNYQNFPEFLFTMPQNIAKELLCKKNDNVYVKKEGFKDWIDLISYIPASLFIAAFFLDQFKLSYINDPSALYHFSEEYLKQFKHTTQPLVYVPELNYLLKNKGLNDLHIHLNGSSESESIWLYMLSNPYRSVKDYKQVYKEKSAVRKLSEQTIASFTPSTLLKRLLKAVQLKNKISQEIALDFNIFGDDSNTQGYNTYNDINLDSLLGIDSFKLEYTPLIKEILFYLITFSELKKYGDEIVACEFYHYLLIKGMVHRLSVMQESQVGFPQFQLLTENSFRFGIESYYQKRFLQLGGGGPINYLNLIEGRFSPGNNKYQLYELIYKIYQGFQKAQSKTPFLENAELVLIAHFIKKRDNPQNNTLPIRHRCLRTELKKKALALSSFIATKNKYSSLIRGIDAAASEFDAGPEVFSHTFRYLKKHGITSCTFHAGEDFCHLLSGIRTIHEAVYFLELERGDRLGHCTAIGIDPQIWMNRTGPTCILSQGEWLDDLVFVWDLIKQSKNQDLEKFIPRIESEILELSYKIYTNKFYPPYILVEAWKLRKYNPFIYLEKSDNTGWNEWNCVDDDTTKENINKILYGISESTNNEEKKDTDICQLLKCYHKFYSIPGNEDKEEYDKLITIDINKILGAKELKVIQNITLNALAEKGIVIEALPTSNLRISYYKNINEYHISKWMCANQEDQHLVPPIVLGSDDPGIFTTNIYNEYALTYLHLQEKYVNSSDIFEKVSNLQRNSIIYNFKNNDK